MPYVKVEPDQFMAHGGVAVFHCYRSGTDEPWDYWFTTDPDTADNDHGHMEAGHFDVRQLTGLWPDTPNVQQWEDWWKPRFKTEDDSIRALIRSAIESGKLRTAYD